MMRKIISLIGIITILAVGMTVAAGCGGSEPVNNTVENPTVVESLTVTGGTEQTATYKVDETLQLEIKIKYVGGAEKPATSADVTYVSSEPSIASVSSNGLVSIKAVGTTEITVSSIYNNVSGAKVVKVINLTVAEPPFVTESLTLTSEKSYATYVDINKYNPEEGYVDNKAQITFNVKYYYEDEERAGNGDEATYTSSDPSVASVSDGGEITFNAIGNCTITVTSKYKTMDGRTVSVDIPVEVKRPESISPYLEITGWRVIEAPVWGSDTPGLYVTFRNNSENKHIFCDDNFDVYCLDENDNIIGYFYFWQGDISIRPQEEYEMTCDMAIGYVPEGTVKMVLLKADEYRERNV